MTIASLQNQTVKNLVRLHTRKERLAARSFLIEGAHLIEEAFQAGLLRRLYLLEGLSLPETCPVPVEFCTQAVLNKISAQKSDARAIGVCALPEVQPDYGRKKTLLLDGVQDPGNVGTLIRSAYAFGADQVILGSGCADPYSSKVIQATQGALFHLPVVQDDCLNAVRNLRTRNIPVFGAALHHDSRELHTLPVPEQYGIVIGSEGQGISSEVLQACSDTLFIEMGQFESLNAAVAGSIILYHFQFVKSR